jgi:hypothetical protein
MRADGRYMSTTSRFPLGQVVATPGALEALAEAGQIAIEFIRRHSQGDWEDLSEDDKRENSRSTRNSGLSQLTTLREASSCE